MAYVGKNPKFDGLILTDLVAATPGNPAAGSSKLINRNGSLYIRNSAGSEVLTAVANNLYVSKSADYVITDSDNYRTIAVDASGGSRTITLPTSADNDDRIITVKKIDTSANTVTVAREGSEVIDAAATAVVLRVNGEAVTVMSNNANWKILDYFPIVNSSSIAYTANGYGSTNTKIRRFTTISNVGPGLTGADSAGNGYSVTVNEPGVYAITYSDASGSSIDFGVTVNSAQLTTNITSTTDADRIALGTATAGLWGSISAVASLAAGDVIRPHSNTGMTATSLSMFRVIQMSKRPY